MRIALGSPKLPSRSPSIPDHSGRADDSYLSAQSRLGLALSIVGGTLTLAANVVLVLMTTQALTSGLAFFLMGPYLAALFGMSITSPLMMWMSVVGILGGAGILVCSAGAAFWSRRKDTFAGAIVALSFLGLLGMGGLLVGSVLGLIGGLLLAGK